MTRFTAVAFLAAALAACAGRPTIPTAPTGRIVPTPDARAVFVEGALAMIGRPYRYGGDSARGFDCSGLVYYAAHRAGFELPRTTAGQIDAGVPVPRDRLRAGDLVFMRFPHEELHVGIAIDGERFVHAPSTNGRVRIDSLTERVYARAFLRARRPRFPP